METLQVRATMLSIPRPCSLSPGRDPTHEVVRAAHDDLDPALAAAAKLAASRSASRAATKRRARLPGHPCRKACTMKRTAKANMVSLFQQMATSPDLTTGHALLLLERYRAEIKAIHDAASEILHFGASPDDIPPLPAAVRRASVDVLDME